MMYGTANEREYTRMVNEVNKILAFIRVNSRLAVFPLAILISFGSAQADDDFPVPPDATLTAVADKMNYEGMTLQIRKFEVDLTVEQVLAFYRAEWKDEFVEDDMPPWKMISSKQGNKFYTVQAQPAGRGSSWGYLGISDLPRALEKRGSIGDKKKFFPMMSGSQIVNDMQHHDIGKQARMLLITNRFSVTSNAEYYRDHYTGNGWSTVIDDSGEPGKSHVLMFQQGSKTVNLTIDQADGKTNIVVNDVHNGLF